MENDVRTKYDASNPKVSFEQLPGYLQTAIVSVATQYGSNLSLVCPKFWKAVREADLQAIVAELRNFGDDFGTRRNLEADLIEHGMANDAIGMLILQVMAEEKKKGQEELDAFAQLQLSNSPWVEISRREVSRRRISDTTVEVTYEITRQRDTSKAEAAIKEKLEQLNETLGNDQNVNAILNRVAQQFGIPMQQTSNQ